MFWDLALGITHFCYIRPFLSKKYFPVGQVGKNRPVGRSGIFSFFLISFFIKKRKEKKNVQGVEVKKRENKNGKRKKRSSNWPF